MQRKRILVLAAFVTALLVEAGVVLAGAGPIGPSHAVPAQRAALTPAKGSKKGIVGHAARPFRTGPLRPPPPPPRPRPPRPPSARARRARPNMPAPSHNFDGIAYPGVNCNCAPPDTNGE